MTGPNAKILFTILFILWALVFGIGLQLVPHEGASSPYGGLGLIALFSGFFIIMGLPGASSATDPRRRHAPPASARRDVKICMAPDRGSIDAVSGPSV